MLHLTVAIMLSRTVTDNYSGCPAFSLCILQSWFMKITESRQHIPIYLTVTPDVNFMHIVISLESAGTKSAFFHFGFTIKKRHSHLGSIVEAFYLWILCSLLQLQCVYVKKKKHSKGTKLKIYCNRMEPNVKNVYCIGCSKEYCKASTPLKNRRSILKENVSTV